MCRYFFTRGQANHNNNKRSHTEMRSESCNLGLNLRPVLAERYFSIRTDFRPRQIIFFPSCHVFFYLSFSFVLIGLRAAAVVERRWKMFSAPHSARSPHIGQGYYLLDDWTGAASKINRLYCLHNSFYRNKISCFVYCRLNFLLPKNLHLLKVW